jgi:hypothetical protein
MNLNYCWQILYIIPVPLDKATIGDATICCPLVIKRDGDSLICSILPTATTDQNMFCQSNKMVSPCFPEAIKRAEFTIVAPSPTAKPGMYCSYLSRNDCNKPVANLNAAPNTEPVKNDKSSDSESRSSIISKENAVFATKSVTFPAFLDLDKMQIIRFGKGIDFELSDEKLSTVQPSAVVLPCILGPDLKARFCWLLEQCLPMFHFTVRVLSETIIRNSRMWW